jgi:uncharacterized protein (DUF1697 family)
VYIALLRAVNVGGSGAVAMADLRRVVAELGLADVRTFLQTGNVLFRCDPCPGATLERRLEVATERALGLSTDVIVRTAPEWNRAVARNPFPQEAREDPAHLVMVLLKGVPAPGAERRLREAVRGRERLRVVGSEAYLVYPDGIARSKLTLPFVEKHLGFRGTGRNWNTVTKLAVRASAGA